MGEDVTEDYEAIKSYSDLPHNCQLALFIYNILPDVWDGMSGTWLGKNYSSIEFFFDIYEILEPRVIFDLILACSDFYYKYYRERKAIAQANKGGKK